MKRFLVNLRINLPFWPWKEWRWAARPAPLTPGHFTTFPPLPFFFLKKLFSIEVVRDLYQTARI